MGSMSPGSRTDGLVQGSNSDVALAHGLDQVSMQKTRGLPVILNWKTKVRYPRTRHGRTVWSIKKILDSEQYYISPFSLLPRSLRRAADITGW